MPELPEVETVARRLADEVAGQRIRAVVINDPKLRKPGLGRLSGHRIHDVFRLGKQVLLSLKPPRARRVSRWLAVHLRMTGQLYWVGTLDRETPYLRAWIQLDRGVIQYADLRRFGRWHLTDDLRPLQPDGLDPTGNDFTVSRLGNLLRGSRQPLKPWLLRQDRLVGLGNIYASEICFQAGIHPARPAGSLSDREIRRLHRVTRAVIEAAISAAGTSFYALEAGRRLSGTFREQLAVYGRPGERCHRCGQKVAKLVQAQRSTFYCPGCQGSDEDL